MPPVYGKKRDMPLTTIYTEDLGEVLEAASAADVLSFDWSIEAIDEFTPEEKRSDGSWDLDGEGEIRRTYTLVIFGPEWFSPSELILDDDEEPVKGEVEPASP